MQDRPYLTSAEAATYCGFKTIGGIQQAVRRGKLKPAGRRGGTGTYVFAKEDLDAFLTGGLKPHERLFVSPESQAQAPPPGRPSTAPKVAAPRRQPPGESPRQPNKSPAQAPGETPNQARARKPPSKDAKHDKDDPVARIIRALATPTPKVEKTGTRPTKR